MGNPPQVWISHSAQLLAGDCACPVSTASSAVSAAPGQLYADTWQHAPATFQRDLVDGWSLLFNLTGNGAVAVLNSTAQHFFESFAIPQRPPAVKGASSDRTAWQDAFTAFAAAGLLQPANSQTEALPPNAYATLSAWLHLTNQCNLRCTYCYLDKNHEQMSPAIGAAAVEAIFRAARLHDFQTVSLKYAGGEAALNFSVLRLIHEEALQRAAADGILLQAMASEQCTTNSGLRSVHRAALHRLTSRWTEHWHMGYLRTSRSLSPQKMPNFLPKQCGMRWTKDCAST